MGLRILIRGKETELDDNHVIDDRASGIVSSCASQLEGVLNSDRSICVVDFGSGSVKLIFEQTH